MNIAFIFLMTTLMIPQNGFSQTSTCKMVENKTGSYCIDYTSPLKDSDHIICSGPLDVGASEEINLRISPNSGQLTISKSGELIPIVSLEGLQLYENSDFETISGTVITDANGSPFGFIYKDFSNSFFQIEKPDGINMYLSFLSCAN